MACRGPRRRPAAILTIGDELLNGDRVDTNASWLASFLVGEGFEVEGILTVGDAPERIRAGIEIALSWSGGGGPVIVTGGLGPTEDDRTREAVAELFGIGVAEDQAILEELRRRFRDRGIGRLPETNRRIAMVPEGAEVLSNAVGSAPGLAFDRSEGRIVLLPGVPAEMRHLATERLVGLFDRWFGPRPRQAVRCVIRTTGIPESALAELIEDRLPDTAAVNLAYRPSVRGVELVMSATGEGADQRVEDALERIADAVEPYRYEAGSGDLAESVLDGLRARGWRIGVAESCTGGMLAARLTGRSGSSDVFLGGMVAYSNSSKAELLGVPASLIQEHGAVSSPVAQAMAGGSARRLGVEVAVGITGIAGPSGGSAEKPVGTVWFGFRTPEREWTECLRFPGDRSEVRIRAVQHALHRVLGSTNPKNDKG